MAYYRCTECQTTIYSKSWAALTYGTCKACGTGFMSRDDCMVMDSGDRRHDWRKRQSEPGSPFYECQRCGIQSDGPQEE